MKAQLEKIIEEVFADENVDLVDVIVRGSSRNRVIQVYVDRQGGVLLADCVALSRKLAAHIEPIEADLKLQAYRLEVSSPGVDRPLMNKRDFERNLNRRVKMRWSDEGQVKTVEGRIVVAEEDAVVLEMKKDQLSVAYSQIEKATIQIEWTSQGG